MAELRSTEEIIDAFRQAGLKITPQRRAIVDILVHDDSHPTAEEIYQRVVSVMPDISRTTVYNTLHGLIAVGALVEVEDLSAGGTRYDTNTGQHHHLFCLGCHALIDIGKEFEGLDLSPEESGGYRIIRRQVTFYGYCPACREE